MSWHQTKNPLLSFPSEWFLVQALVEVEVEVEVEAEMENVTDMTDISV